MGCHWTVNYSLPKQCLEVRKWKYSTYQYCTIKMLLENHYNKIHTGPPYGPSTLGLSYLKENKYNYKCKLA